MTLARGLYVVTVMPAGNHGVSCTGGCSVVPLRDGLSFVHLRLSYVFLMSSSCFIWAASSFLCFASSCMMSRLLVHTPGSHIWAASSCVLCCFFFLCSLSFPYIASRFLMSASSLFCADLFCLVLVRLSLAPISFVSHLVVFLMCCFVGHSIRLQLDHPLLDWFGVIKCS